MKKRKKNTLSILLKLNGQYFKRFNNWNQFVERNYLQDFFQKSDFEHTVSLTPSKEFFPSYIYSRLSKLPEEKKKECIEQISIFLTNAIMIITARAERLARLENNASFVLS